MKRQIRSKWIKVVARAMDHRIGTNDEDPPELPRLTVEEALVSFWLRVTILVVNLVTCGFVMANVVRHW